MGERRGVLTFGTHYEHERRTHLRDLQSFADDGMECRATERAPAAGGGWVDFVSAKDGPGQTNGMSNVEIPLTRAGGPSERTTTQPIIIRLSGPTCADSSSFWA